MGCQNSASHCASTAKRQSKQRMEDLEVRTRWAWDGRTDRKHGHAPQPDRNGFVPSGRRLSIFDPEQMNDLHISRPNELYLSVPLFWLFRRDSHMQPAILNHSNCYSDVDPSGRPPAQGTIAAAKRTIIVVSQCSDCITLIKGLQESLYSWVVILVDVLAYELASFTL